ncbi:protein of unknown function [Streptococcus thermophilus]|uniref:Uncharacterized protein n=1 Tax=Streptococcus thermophilus TaxID=1308 RepID=A0A7U7C5V1_STRTR|nr:protein of unknown function [Streptococcus thermophilus]CAD0144468.1 protein of unknown function [Streptococcus thermophilus]CAD0147997.1 protein of unknown function [Streptococcus thermophilus]CAD0149737.1 protein of unknown function [Streptococcus thermophilus]CAD0152075.1 protein of unknown function [Streptococcus thermophilus]
MLPEIPNSYYALANHLNAEEKQRGFSDNYWEHVHRIVKDEPSRKQLPSSPKKVIVLWVLSCKKSDPVKDRLFHDIR